MLVTAKYQPDFQHSSRQQNAATIHHHHLTALTGRREARLQSPLPRSRRSQQGIVSSSSKRRVASDSQQHCAHLSAARAFRFSLMGIPRFSVHRICWYHHKTTPNGTGRRLDKEFEQPKPAVRTLERRKSFPALSHWHTALLSSPKPLIPPQGNTDLDEIRAWSRVRTSLPSNAHT
jgi:hypothetical protein